jgi:hypothetical protein
MKSFCMKQVARDALRGSSSLSHTLLCCFSNHIIFDVFMPQTLPFPAARAVAEYIKNSHCLTAPEKTMQPLNQDPG